MRTRKERDRLYARFEGLAVKAANDVWEAYSGQIIGRAAGLDDVVQEARLLLIGSFATIRPRHGGCKTWVYRTVRGGLLNRFVSGSSQPSLVNLGEDYAKVLGKLPQTDPEALYFSEESDQVFCDLVLAGIPVEEARGRVGWDDKEYREAKRRIERELKI